ncbi:unnamed protein product [Mesocestoides corti]|uniref:Ubiquitin-like domain-containing protein n=1 Tax=Mesocestoides corti TaxID=53468 RepID=A0A0R3UIY1_MESCO|nr:unnamed protein product [Mesocestoides corti]
MLIEVEHLDSKILTLKVDNEISVENLKKAISQSIHIPTSYLTLASNGALLEDGFRFSPGHSDDTCKVLLFLRRGEKIKTNLEVDFGHGRVVLIAACMNWKVSELKQVLQNAIGGEPFDKKVFTFARYILEDDRTLEEYKLKEGSRITVFSYLEPQPTSEVDKDASIIRNGVEPQLSPKSDSKPSKPSDVPQKSVSTENFPQYKLSEEPVQTINKQSSVSPPHSSPQSRKSYLPMRTEETNSTLQVAPVSPSTAEQSPPWAIPVNRTVSQSPKDPNTSPITSEPQTLRSAFNEPKTITIPGGFRQSRQRSGFAKQLSTPLPSTNNDKMSINFTDGRRVITLELQASATVSEGLEALEAKLPASDKNQIYLFKGAVQMDGRHPLKHYGIVHGTTVSEVLYWELVRGGGGLMRVGRAPCPESDSLTPWRDDVGRGVEEWGWDNWVAGMRRATECLQMGAL